MITVFVILNIKKEISSYKFVSIIMVGSHKLDNEPSGCIKAREFVD
jgi:hypothetical protein